MTPPPLERVGNPAASIHLRSRRRFLRCRSAMGIGAFALLASSSSRSSSIVSASSFGADGQLRHHGISSPPIHRFPSSRWSSSASDGGSDSAFANAPVSSPSSPWPFFVPSPPHNPPSSPRSSLPRLPSRPPSLHCPTALCAWYGWKNQRPLPPVSPPALDDDEHQNMNDIDDENDFGSIIVVAPRLFLPALEVIDLDVDGEYDDDYDEDETPNLRSIGSLSNLPTLERIIASGAVPEIAYYYLRDTIGLSDRTMWRITQGAGSVLGMTPANLRKKIKLIKRLADLSDEDVRMMISRGPTVLQLSADTNVAPTAAWLCRVLGLEKADLRKILVSYPNVLNFAPQNLRRKVGFFLNRLGYGTAEARELLVENPYLFMAGVESLTERYKFLRHEIGIRTKDLRLIYKKNPQLLMYAVETNLRAKLIGFFILQLRLEPDHVRKVLLSYPQVLDYNLEERSGPLVRYLVDELGFGHAQVRSVVVKYPRILSHSLAHIKRTAGYLRWTMGMNALQVKRVLYQAPNVIGLKIETTLAGKAERLKGRLGLTDGELAVLLSKAPTILFLDVENNVEPKLDFLQRALGEEVEDGSEAVSLSALKETIFLQPNLLTYSLEKRIVPRMERVMQAGLEPCKITVGISMTEDKFGDWIVSSVARANGTWKRKVVARPETVRQKETPKAPVEKKDSWDGVRTFLRSKLTLTDEELDLLLPPPSDSSSSSSGDGTKSRQREQLTPNSVRSCATYLLECFDGSASRTKAAVLAEPLLLQCALGRRLRPRMELLTSLGYPPEEIVPAISLPGFRLGTYQLAGYLRVELGFSDDDILAVTKACLFGNKDAARTYQGKLEYLLDYFNGSKEDLREALVAVPSVLNNHLERRIARRATALKKMESFGVTYSPVEAARLMETADPTFMKSLLGGRFTWYPETDVTGKSAEDEDAKVKAKKVEEEPVTKIEFAHSDDEDCESARIVHWR